jgi:hypothetical protein
MLWGRYFSAPRSWQDALSRVYTDRKNQERVYTRTAKMCTNSGHPKRQAVQLSGGSPNENLVFSLLRIAVLVALVPARSGGQSSVDLHVVLFNHMVGCCNFQLYINVYDAHH